MRGKTGGAGCATLVTSRHPKVGNELAPKSTDIVQLDCLNADHSLELLSKLAGEDVVQDYLAQCKELAVDLEGLPLALNVAGCWLRSAVRKGWDVAEEFADLRDMTRVLESTAPANMSAFLDESNNITVAALLKKSTDCLKQESLYRFATLGAYPAKPAVFPLSMVSRAWETQEEGARETVNELMDFGLMERTDASLLWIHSLLVAFAKTLWVEDE